MKKIAKVVAGSLWALPFMAFAADPQLGYFSSFLTQLKTIIDNAVIFLVALAVAWFIWNVIRYTIAEDEDKKSAAKSQMIWGIVAIAVIVSIWGLVALLQGFFGVSKTGSGTVIPSGFIPNVR